MSAYRTLSGRAVLCAPYRLAVLTVLAAWPSPLCEAVLQQWDRPHGRPGERARHLQSGRGGSFHAGRSEETCVPLLDRTAYMVVALTVGTPPQSFEVVLDSGSSSVVVLGCGWTGTEEDPAESTTSDAAPGESTALERVATSESQQDQCYEPGESTTNEAVPYRVITTIYGKGKVTSTVATDVVRVGGTEVLLEKSLMVGTSFEELPRDFHGIFGLGPKIPDEDAPTSRLNKLFMEEAGVSRYSICFAEGFGSLRIDPPLPAPPPLSIIAGAHWALNIARVSAGEVASSSCTESAPCTAIVDSGTTGIAVPKGRLVGLFETLCDAWPRCVEKTATSDESTSDNFFSLLYTCEEWLPEKGLDELPSLSFAVSGSDGKSQTLTLSPWAYVEERVATAEYYESVGRDSRRDGHDSWSAGQGSRDEMLFKEVLPGRAHHGPPGSKVCWPFFQEWSPPAAGTTKPNTWILGTSLFYEYAVHHDISTTPPSVSFETGNCGGCGGSAANLRASFGGDRSGRRPMRKLDRPPRLLGGEVVRPPV